MGAWRDEAAVAVCEDDEMVQVRGTGTGGGACAASGRETERL